MSFASLHNHCWASNQRFLDSINRPKDMIDKAIKLGFKGIAFTDHESLSASVEILKARDKIQETNPDFKIIFGNEIYLIDETEIKNNPIYYHFILLAKDLEGWKQIRQLSSKAWERGYVEKGIMRVPTTYQDIEEIVGKNPGHVVANTACLGGQLPKLILDHKVKEANQFVKWCIKVFGKDNFNLELQPSDSEEQFLVNKTLIKFAVFYKIPYIITTDSHYLNKEDFKIHSAFLNSKQSSDRETEKFYRFTYIMSEDEMRETLKLGELTDEQITQGFENTCKVADKIETFDFRHLTIVPKIVIPPFTLNKILYKKGYPVIDKFYDSDDKQNLYLMYQIEQGLITKNIEVDSVKLERINTELDVIDYISQKLNQPLSAYLNLTTDIVNRAWEVSLVGCGRGSACGEYINYLLGITQLDPLKYNLQWWRFLNKERVELPDVDEDFQPEKTEEITKLLREAYGEDNVLNCATFKTESLKSAILTAMRGMGYNNDDAQALAALVPSHRGATYTLKECLEGDEEKGYDPVPNFKAKLDVYPGLFEAVQKIEGLPTNISIHASALYVFNDGYLAHNSLMRAPNGTKITAFSMGDSNDLGALKMDALRTDAESKIAKTMELLLKDKQIEWQGNLRKTYDKYLHPDVLDYDNKDMWKQAAEGQITNLFQFETQVGSVCIKKARPSTLRELAEINSIMRLQTEGDEQPIDRYVKFRNDPSAWELEMVEEGLNEHEIAILKKYLSDSHGVSGSQEVLMQLLMDPEICNFTLGEANAARKAISKKQAAKILHLKQDIFEKGGKIARKELLNYVFKYCIEPQLGYSFSINHTMPYSAIGVQEMNLATRWNPLYWQCACLCVNAGNYVGDIEDSVNQNEDVEEENIEENGESIKKARKVAPNYGKISRAIANAQLAGVKIDLPDINKAQVDFIPDVEHNSILYSLQAISVVSDDLLDKILTKRPFSSIEDFIEKVEPTQGQMFGLIKAGCFDNLCGQPRGAIMEQYLNRLAEEKHPLKEKMTAVQIKKALELGFELSQFNIEIRVFKFKKYIDAKQIDKENKRYLLTEDVCIKFFNTYIKSSLDLSKNEYTLLPEGKVAIKQSAFKKVFDKIVAPLMEYMNSEEGRKKYQETIQNQYKEELKEKYCPGTISKWEMDTMSFYREGHELKNMNDSLYNTADFEKLPELPGDKPQTCTVAGTIIDTNNTRHTVSLLTNYGVVDVKLYNDIYLRYNQNISTIDPVTKKKTVIERSWLQRGNKIIVHGFRRENMFCARVDRSSGYARVVGLIERVRGDGSLSIKYARTKK